MIDRRGLIAGLTLISAGAARAAPPARLFPDGPLAGNLLARGFLVPPAGLDPDPPLLSATGPKRWRDLRGKPHVVSLWAEWCTPCLAEAQDFAKLARDYRGRGVGVVAILTASQQGLDLGAAEALMARMHAADLPVWIEPRGGRELFRTVAHRDGESSLPCTLILDRDARIRGRAFGAPHFFTLPAEAPKPPMTSHALTRAEKERILEHPEPTAWASPYATQLMDALAAGAV
jgi:thiol-disulfide isomerase/thioredoxin